jgi:hypothetical protein
MIGQASIPQEAVTTFASSDRAWLPIVRGPRLRRGRGSAATEVLRKPARVEDLWTSKPPTTVGGTTSVLAAADVSGRNHWNSSGPTILVTAIALCCPRRHPGLVSLVGIWVNIARCRIVVAPPWAVPVGWPIPKRTPAESPT